MWDLACSAGVSLVDEAENSGEAGAGVDNAWEGQSKRPRHEGDGLQGHGATSPELWRFVSAGAPSNGAGVAVALNGLSGYGTDYCVVRRRQKVVLGAKWPWPRSATFEQYF